MQIYKIGIPEIAIGPIASKLKSSLYSGPTLWLIPGGSNVSIAVAVMDRLDTELSSGLTVGLTDERYGPVNHPDSNWHQLIEAGFDPKKAKVLEVLREGESLHQSVERYGAELESAIEVASVTIGQFGMGADGHIAGIIPGSMAANESIPNIVISYESQPYTRITLSFKGIERLNEAFLIAFGPEKLDALNKLVNQDLSLTDQPAQIIKRLEQAYIYNDQLEGSTAS